MRDHSEDFFSPPLWRQRRSFILDNLLRFKISSVLDYGCGEASVLSFLIPPSDPPIVRMAGIDLDRQVLEEAVESCVPWQSDYTVRRTHPLTIDIYHGSIDAVDSRLEGYDAIICSEVIEHVYNNVLDTFFPVTLGHYQPNIMIVTTPNGEYNVNFPDLKYGTPEATFRHDDHKFEWTRQQFQKWCQEGAKKYGYSIEFHGIGLLHGKQTDLTHGHCTQACIFIREACHSPPISAVTDDDQFFQEQQQQPHTLIKHIEFPYYDDPPLEEHDLLKEVESYIEKLCIAEDYYLQESKNNTINAMIDKPPTPPPTDETDDEDDTQEEIAIDQKEKQDTTTSSSSSLYWCLDWNNSNTMIESITPPSPPVNYTIVPIQLPISCLWDVLRLRQICRTKQRLVEILKSYDQEHYEVCDDLLIVKKVFAINTNTDNNNDDDDQSLYCYSSEDEM